MAENSCAGNGSNAPVFACSGASNVGQIANSAALGPDEIHPQNQPDHADRVAVHYCGDVQPEGQPDRAKSRWTLIEVPVMIGLVNAALFFQWRYFAHELQPAGAQIVSAAGEACPPLAPSSR